MSSLRDFHLYDIAWDLAPEQAVTLFLEWGNNDWKSEFPPVRSQSDCVHYFVIDTWNSEPMIRLVKRDFQNAEDLIVLPLPEHLRADFYAQCGTMKGISAPTEAIKTWLKQELA